jgi:uncharacterized protein
MNDRARFLIEALELKPHPEGGHYREIFRSSHQVQPGDARASRSALTAIYFLLEASQHSRWHRVLSDEIWSHLEGGPLQLCCFDAGNAQVTKVKLGGYDASGTAPIHVIPAGVWQAARPLGEYALVGCYVAPGFDFSDFFMAADDAEVSRLIREQGEEFGKLL